MGSTISKIKWHPWRGSYRFVLLQKEMENDITYTNDIDKRNKIIRYILKTTRLDKCKTEHLNVLYDILDNLGESNFFYLPVIVKLAMTINGNPNKTICWEIIGEMLKKKCLYGMKRKKTVLQPFLLQYKEIVEKNIHDYKTLTIIVNLFYEVYNVCPIPLKPLSSEAQKKVVEIEKGKLLVEFTEPLSQPNEKETNSVFYY